VYWRVHSDLLRSGDVQSAIARNGLNPISRTTDLAFMSSLIDIPQDVVARAAKIKLVAFDVDGTLTDGRLWMTEDGREIKAFHVHDGLGIKRLRERGIEIALISARISHAVELRAEQLGIDHVYQGKTDKLDCLQDILSASGLSAEHACYVGDDLPDLAAMRVCGLAIAVADARPEVAAAAHWQTRAGGGRGAAREVCDFIVAALPPEQDQA
jgi:3-deoxy-D-manno-octulosonate 8-phosphate phosphatase (KDO 8-P phosphatase)